METVQWKGDINARCKVKEIKLYFVNGAPDLVQPVTTCLCAPTVYVCIASLSLLEVCMLASLSRHIHHYLSLF